MDKISSSIPTSSTSVAWWEKILAQLSERRPTATLRATPDTGSAAGASAQFSGAANVYRELSNLQKSDPTQFKQVMSDVSKQMLDVAGQMSAGAEQSRWAELASRFARAASTGDASAVMPAATANGGTYSRSVSTQPTTSIYSSDPRSVRSAPATCGARSPATGPSAPPAQPPTTPSAPATDGGTAVRSSTSYPSQLYPPRDLNRDGTITAQEDTEWRLENPAYWLSEWPAENRQAQNSIGVKA